MRCKHVKVLVVDDEKLIRNVVKEYLTLEGIEVDEASDGDEAIALTMNQTYDLIVMDVMMPHKDGFSTVKEIKKTQEVPVIMLSARGEEYDKLIGFDLGIDDYVTKPFSPKELVARIKAVTKRERKSQEKITLGELVIDDSAHEVRIQNQVIDLTPKEYDLLNYFVSNNHIALSREQLLSRIWGYDFYGDDRTVDTHVKTLRHQLGEYGKCIKTIRKVGYKFDYE
ncbi:MAG: response regulator transcription factor [Bacilli bacterium]|nr:response regulator transcription factor [Bacilli bacterium]MBR1749034.1 response regulator transcription factor [Bacilli bacterium]MBR1817663.1 response regulator transcription factor [Bacilli bacterium]